MMKQNNTTTKPIIHKTNNMEQQTNLTAVEWLVEKLRMIDKNAYAEIYDDIKAAKQMEKERRKQDVKIGYNQGYLDAQCNHVNDADTFANDQDYLNSEPTL